MLKADLRKQALAQRKALSQAQRLSLNKSLLEGFKTLDFSEVKTIHIFLPIAVQGEPDTFLLINWLKATHPEIEIIVPKADFESNLLINHYFEAEDIALNDYHIPEPNQSGQFTGSPDMVIIPLLAFDELGYRVGYGKGFYDRFLQGLSTQKIGLSFFDAVKEINDVHLNDIRMDKCITPTKVYTFINQ